MTVLSILGTTLADGYGGMHDWDGGWMWLWGTLMMVAFVALAGFVLWAILRDPIRDRGVASAGADPTAAARAVLAERYARGEIDRDEYRERLGELGG